MSYRTKELRLVDLEKIPDDAYASADGLTLDDEDDGSLMDAFLYECNQAIGAVDAPVEAPKEPEKNDGFVPARPMRKANINTDGPGVEMLESFIDLPDELMTKTIIGKLSRRVAECIEFPEASVFAAILTSASASVSCAYATAYATGSPVNCGLYAVIEQPPAMQKGYLLSVGMKPYEIAIRDHNKRVHAKNREILEKGIEGVIPLKTSFTLVDDATSASLDGHLNSTNEGRYVIADSEQTTFNSLFPEGKSYSSNNALLLKGWPGEYASGMRSGRKAFEGVVRGTILVISQTGSIKRIFSASGGTGLAERFIFVAEPTTLGTRVFPDEFVTNQDTEKYYRACHDAVITYSNIAIGRWEKGETSQIGFDDLIIIKPTKDGYRFMKENRRKIESKVGTLNDSGEKISAGWLAKYEAYVLKVATVIHVIECLGERCDVSPEIPLSTIRMASDYIMKMNEHLSEFMKNTGETGKAAEQDVVISALEKPQVMQSLLRTLKNRSPFRSMKSGHIGAKSRVEKMINEGLLIVNKSGKIEVV